MKALIDTNILINREMINPIDPEIGTLFYWLEKLGYKICVHPTTKEEILKNKNKKTVDAFLIKMNSYEELGLSRNLNPKVKKICEPIDRNVNDTNDTKLIDEIYSDRVDIFISADKKIHEKAKMLKIADKVFTIKTFLESVAKNTPGLKDYDVLSIRKEKFSAIDLNDPFFDSLKKEYTNDYTNFSKWFNRKLGEEVYTLRGENGKLEAFLYLKIEYPNENYSDIKPPFKAGTRLKIGTLKVSKTGMRLGERFLKIIFDNASLNHVDEIYVTVFNNTKDELRLIDMLEDWGFLYHGIKNKDEMVYCRKYKKSDNQPVNRKEPKKTFPYISQSADFYIISIRPEYHTDLFPDSILRGENPADFDEAPHRNAISKSYISLSPLKELKSGDAIVFYRTGGIHKGVCTTVGIVEEVMLDIKREEDLIEITNKRTVYNQDDLKNLFKRSLSLPKEYRVFVINFLFAGTLKKKLNLEELKKRKIVDNGPRSIVKISKESFGSLINENL